MFTPTDEHIFKLEMWSKGPNAFFRIENLPLSAYSGIFLNTLLSLVHKRAVLRN